MARGRAFRRYRARRAKAKAYRFLTGFWGISDRSWKPDATMIGRWASTHCKPCSCPMCCNWRAYEGPTRQELLSELSEKEQIEEIDND